MLTVIIPVTPDRLHEITAAVASARQPNVEVLVVVDGPWSGDVAGADTVVVLGRNYGVGTARMAGALHAQHDLLFFLDSDDTMIPGAAARAIDDLGRYAAVLYRARGASAIAEPEFGAGVLARGAIADHWAEHGITSHIATMSVRRGALLVVGGFPGLPRMEDWLTWAAINERYEVLVSDFVARTYAEHPGQVTAAAWPEWITGLAAVWIPALRAARTGGSRRGNGPRR